MATKGKRGSRKAKKKSEKKQSAVATVDRSAESYVNQWNQLVSTTNWEKGRIICQWRETLTAEGAAAADYSDEAWANLVGGVTGQHVGRLRRVFQQFGEVWQEYPGLFWSHFQVAMEWNDAEMWLEGSVQNGWSVSQMRAARWEAHGAPADMKPRDEDIIVGEIDEDMVATATVRDPSARADEEAEDDEWDDAETTASATSRETGSSAKRTKAEAATDETEKPSRRESKRPFAELPELPDDVGEAFEQFKLAILTHKRAGWKEISRDDLLATLDALKELAQLPAE